MLNIHLCFTGINYILSILKYKTVILNYNYIAIFLFIFLLYFSSKKFSLDEKNFFKKEKKKLTDPKSFNGSVSGL